MTISRRLFIYIILMVLGFATLILLSNTLLLRPLYIWSVKNTMLGAVDDFAGIDYTQDADVWIEELSVVADGKAYDVVIRSGDALIFSSSSEVGLMSRPGMGQNNAQKPWRGDLSFLHRPQGWTGFDTTADGTYIGIASMQDGKTEMMVCFRAIDEDTTVFLTQPVAPVDESVQQANYLLIGCAILSLIILTFVVLKISKRFTKPIREIQSTVGRIAQLNFDERCDVKTGDELESLGSDVNVLSDALQGALLTLESQNAQLERDIVAQKKFIANASHELRTPLSLIKGYADEMSSGIASDAESRQAYIGIIADEAAKMNRLLREMLELSRMESGSVEMHNETLSVGGQVRAFVEKYDGFITANRLEITLDLEDDTIGTFDAMRFEQVLANYVSNAARYGDDKKRIEISVRKHESSIRVSVFNTGLPIPEEMIDSLWDGFFKADDARTRSGEGYGLGLSIVKAIQTAAGQDFGAANVLSGVEFWFDVARVIKEND